MSLYYHPHHTRNLYDPKSKEPFKISCSKTDLFIKCPRCFFVLNINYDGKSEVDKWLSKEELAPIFYGKCTIEQIRNNKGHELTPRQFADAKRFVDAFSHADGDAVIFSIGDEDIYIYKQAGQLREFPEYKKPHNDLVKGFKVELIRREKIKYCPLILVSIKTNRYIASGTFKNLSHDRYVGNTKALNYLIDRKPVKVSSFMEYLQCLSSLEFETLIAKYLEESGFFVPAYKGGFIRNYDLFCRNITDKTIKVEKITVNPRDSISVQVKLRLKKNAYNKTIDHFFCIESDEPAENIHDYKYLQRNIEKTPVTKKWLENTLYWVN